MKTVQRIAKNSLVLLTSNIISKILGFFYVMYIARYLGAEGFGILSFALAFTGIFSVFSDLGLGPLTVREVARDKSLAGKYLGNITVIKIFLVIITFGLIAITINLLGYPKQTIKVVYFLALSVIFSSFSNIFNSIFQAYEKMQYQSIEQILSSILVFSGALFAINQGFSVVGFALIYFLVSAVILGYSFTICAWKFDLPKIEVDFNFWKPIIKEALPFGLSGIFITIYYWIDSVMLSLMKGNEVVGWYNAAYRLIVILLFVPGIINIVVFPAMSRFHISSQNSLNLMSRKYFKFMLAIGIPIGVGTTLLADKVILLIFGAGYIQSIIALQILVWAMVFVFANAAFVRLFESTNKQIIVTKITGIGMIENIVLNLLIIPRFGYVGASITTVITEFTIVTLVLIFAYKTGYSVQRREFLTNISKVIIASLIMGVFIWKLISLNLPILILLSTLLYIGILYIIGGINKEDIELLKQVRSQRHE
jgi:O-antigen/teichoic acid export membrane protein